MDWNGTLRTFVSRPEPSLNFLYNYDQYSAGLGLAEAADHQGLDKNMNNQEKKKRLTSDQLESLERSFQEEIKLDPDRKVKLSRDLGLQPRQIAVWFQNRRARWKAKQLQRLYDALKQDYDLVSREKQKLQDEVMKLKGMLREQGTRNQVLISTVNNYTEISREETVESTSIRSSNKPRVLVPVPVPPNQHHQNLNIAECNYIFNVDQIQEYNNPVSSSSPYWALHLPSYP